MSLISTVTGSVVAKARAVALSVSVACVVVSPTRRATFIPFTLSVLAGFGACGVAEGFVPEGEALSCAVSLPHAATARVSDMTPATHNALLFTLSSQKRFRE
ncbi:hypothetical protein GCM10010342_47100 [Streptomyces anulatus]|nr:hypothetical protein GCM10010342_47100 [Streptomyces anulatus]